MRYFTNRQTRTHANKVMGKKINCYKIYEPVSYIQCGSQGF